MPSSASQRSEIGALFFELAHPARLSILATLRGRALRLSDVASHLRTAPPETHRHLTRLSSQGLVQRQPDGTFRLTGYGFLVAEGAAALEGLLPRRDFFRTHDLSVIPREFVSRLYVLAGTEAGSTFSDSLRHVERVLTEAERFAWFLSDQAMLNVGVLLNATRRSGVAVRVLIPSSILPPAERRVTPVPRDLPFELRALPEVRIAMALNEKLAGACFADFSGSIDYARGFRGASPGFRAWCQELFEHYWKLGRPIRVW